MGKSNFDSLLGVYLESIGGTVNLTITWIGALLLGFLGGILGVKLSAPKAIDLPGATRAQEFELLDRSGNVASVWTTDRFGRPILAMNDKGWEGRIIIGPLFPTGATQRMRGVSRLKLQAMPQERHLGRQLQ